MGDWEEPGWFFGLVGLAALMLTFGLGCCAGLLAAAWLGDRLVR